MKQKILLKTMLLLCALVAGTSMSWADNLVYTLSFTKLSSGTNYNSYTGSHSITCDGISWDGYGNQSLGDYIRVGGKDLTGIDRVIKSSETISGDISKITFNHNGVSNASLVVNSVTLTVASNSAFSTPIEVISKTPSFSVGTSGSFDFNAGDSGDEVTSWGEDKYYKFTINVSNSSTSKNYGLDVTSIEFYEVAGGGSSTYTVTYNANGATSGDVPIDDNDYDEDDDVTVLGNTGSLVKAGSAFGGWNTQADGNGTNYTAGNTFTISGNTTLYAKWNPYSITAVSNDEDMGTVSGTTTITASPKSGYRVKAGTEGYTVTSGTAAVTNNGDNTFTVVPSTDCTVTINFEAIPVYTVTFSDGGSVSEAYGGAGVDLPSRSDKGDYEFAGWSETNVPTETTTAPTIIPVGTYNPTDDVTLYPVYTRIVGAAPTAFSVGNTGDFVIVAKVDDDYYALPTNPTVSSGKITGEVITVSEYSGVKYVTPANATGYTWEIAEATNGYTISDGIKYIYHSNGGASGTNLTYGSSISYTWAFEAVDGCIKMAGMNDATTNSRGMLFNGTAFGGYALSNWGASGYYKTEILPVATGGTTYYWSGTQTVTITAGFATFSAPYAIDFSATSLNVYTAAVSGDKVVLTSVPSKQVPANTGVVLEGTTSNGILIASASALAGNELVAAAADNSSKGNGLTIYALGVGKDGDAKDKVGFYLVNNGQTIPAGKAYLEVTTPVKEFLTFSFEDDADGLERVQDVQEVQGAIFNLAGQRLSKMQKGINIVNGKKILY